MMVSGEKKLSFYGPVELVFIISDFLKTMLFKTKISELSLI